MLYYVELFDALVLVLHEYDDPAFGESVILLVDEELFDVPYKTFQNFEPVHIGAF